MTPTPKITQEMIDLYDEFTHVTLDRRAMMERMARLAGGAAAAAAVVHMIGGSPALAQQLPEDDPSIVAEWVTFPGAGGEVRGYLVRPAMAQGPLPAVAVVHENRGIVPHIQDVTRRMAAEGFLALGVDFLSPLGGTPENEDAARPLFDQLTPELIVAVGEAAVGYLSGHELGNGKVGAVGFCWGGGTVNRLATSVPALAAGVAYYGAQPDAAEVPNIEAAMLLHYGGLDERINAGIDAYRAALQMAQVEHEIFVYEGANHAFNNDTSEARYDPQAAMLAWQRTVDFFRSHLA